MTAAPNNSMQLEGKTILLGITGGIAAYKSCNIVRLLQKRGARVKVVMSEHATEFVGPLTFRALTNEPVAVGLFDDPSDPIHHISLAQEPDLVVVAPATANIIAKIAVKKTCVCKVSEAIPELTPAYIPEKRKAKSSVNINIA